MTRDFTFEMYERLLAAGVEVGYEHITVREYLSSDALPERFIIHRHDVDRKPGNALAMAQLEAEYGISSTYYFRTIEKTFKPEVIREIESLGHEIGYHYEDMDRAEGDIEAAHASFAEHLGRLREVATVDTVCMHGNPLTAYDNREMWDGSKGFNEYELLGEAYLSMDFVDVTYFSDTGRTWRDCDLKIKDFIVGQNEKRIQVNATRDLIIELENATLLRCCILSHPNRWATTSPELVAEYCKDKTTNLGKRFLNLVK